MQLDTSGHERFQSLVLSYYQGAHGIIAVYDITNMVYVMCMCVCVLLITNSLIQDSFKHTQQWLQKMDKYASPSAAKLLVGNKSELTDKRVVDFATGKVSIVVLYTYSNVCIGILVM